MGRRRREDSPELQSIDAHVGQRIRLRRTLLGMSQTQLGQAINLTFQQIQKYERGTNRVSAGMLYRISTVLDVPVSFFFDCYEGDGAGQPAPQASADPAVAQPDISRREARLLRFWRQSPPEVADQIFDLLAALARQSRRGVQEDEAEEEFELDDLEADEIDDDADDLEGDSSWSAVDESRDESNSRGRRRRPGAVWDPADIR